jgi:NAD(P)-dependent dehydrogenase (short-subunit alcohol dehydrogenase family)
MNSENFEDLKNKVCVITGGSGVIGFAIVQALASAGVKVAVISRNKNKTAEKLSSDFSDNKNAIAVEGDVIDKNSLLKAKEEVNQKLGKINILINCAGGNFQKATTELEYFDKESKNKKEKSFLGLDVEAVQNVFNLNFLGTLIPSQVFSEDMVEQNSGVILNISSISSFRPLTKVSAYSAAKAGINNFTQWLSVHLADLNIRVNAIAPGFILAEQNKYLLIDKDTGEFTKRGEKIIAATPMKRFVEPEEIRGAVLFLVSDLSKAITGVVLQVDGGFNAYAGV